MRPNLFHYATSELSQDAVLCWLLSWAKPEHKDDGRLHWIGVELLTLIYTRAKVALPNAFTSVEVRKQAANIDILCIVNGKTAIIIEDKTGSKQHSGQLARYKDYVFTTLGFTADHVIPVYIQTGDESDYNEVAKNGYLILGRADLLRILEGDNGVVARNESDIFDNFASRLRQIEDDVQSYRSLSLEKWTWNSWKGFYSRIQGALGEGNWDYVSNPAGGFLGFWWHFRGSADCEVYLQIEQDKFCFKIVVEPGEKRRDFRDHWHNLVISKCPEHGLRAKRPDRFGNGVYMTVVILDQEFRVMDSNGLIDMEATIKVLHSAESVLDDCLLPLMPKQSEKLIR
jgi:hypothetical protein